MSTWRAVQRGRGPVIVSYLASPALDGDLRDTFPGRPIVATSEGGVQTSLADVNLGAALVGQRVSRTDPLVAVGYSAGCQGVRKLLLDGANVVAAATIDGTASSLPVSPAHRGCWQAFAARARAGAVCWVATCTQQTYVERLRPGAYASTVRVLSEVVGKNLAVASDRPQSGLGKRPDGSRYVTGWPAKGEIGLAVREGSLHVYSFRSADMDHAEHAHQGAVILREMLAAHVAPYLAVVAPTGGAIVDHDDDPPATLPERPARPTIREGTVGGDVAFWQGIVGARQDGRFGKETARLTRIWQQDRGLVPDAIVGARTWREAGETPALAGAVASKGVDPRAPACVAALRDANLSWPGRSKKSDGIMGDARHQAKPSDHNSGDAVDITHDPENGCDASGLALLAVQDERVTYVIWNRQIFNRDRAAEGWRRHTGGNPHTAHVHISVRKDARADAGPWPWAPPAGEA